MTLPLTDIVTFLAVVEQGSFTAAARTLGQPKTTVSRRVRALEARLGAQLLRRTTRTLSLTEAGTALFARCRRIPDTLADAEAAVAQLQGEPRGTLRVTAAFSLLQNLIGPRLPIFQQRYPRVRLDLIATHRTLDLVATGIDIALRTGPLADTTMVARRLAVLADRVWASPGYLARHGAPTHPDELKAHAILTTRRTERGEKYFWTMTSAEGRQDFEIRPLAVADDPELLKPMLVSGAGLMMATDMVMARLAERGLVRAILPGWNGRCPELHAVFPGGALQPPKLRAFVDFLVETLNRPPPETAP